ncbi:MAG: hypothetical protein AAFV33_29525, partial [Chloroflexota bacterium]
VLLMLGLLEGLLRTVDPLGIDRLATTLRQMSRLIDEDDPRGFGLPPGSYPLQGNWRLTIDEDRNRLTPDAVESDCRIVFVGDSVTIGQGVNDEDVWVNHLADGAAAAYVNAGFSGFNIYQVSATVNNRDADGYVYLLVNNDFDINIPFEGNPAGGVRAFVQQYVFRATYVYVVAYRSGLIRPAQPVDTGVGSEVVQPASLANNERELAVLDRLVERDDVLILAMEGASLTAPLVERYPEIVVIEPYTEVISWFDAHANAQGNLQIAEAVRPALEAFVQQRCT